MHKLATLVVGTERSITGNVATFHHEIWAATIGFVIQSLRRCRQQHQCLGLPGQPTFRKASMLAQPAQYA